MTTSYRTTGALRRRLTLADGLRPQAVDHLRRATARGPSTDSGQASGTRGSRTSLASMLVLVTLLVAACGAQTAPGAQPAAFGSASPRSLGDGVPAVSATPTPQYHEVQPGEALWQIAQRYGINPDILAEVNELDDPNLIQPGQQLLISDRVTISGRALPTATPTPRPCLEGCSQPPPGCDIKGIVAQLDGTRLYLLPDDELYDLRTADLWFCREQDAQNAGWLHWTPSGPKRP